MWDVFPTPIESWGELIKRGRTGRAARQTHVALGFGVKMLAASRIANQRALINMIIEQMNELLPLAFRVGGE